MKKNIKKSAPKTAPVKHAVLRVESPVVSEKPHLKTFQSGRAITACLRREISSLKLTVVKP